MSYAAGDTVPIGPFEWVARVNGNLCDAEVDWTWTWAQEGAAENPPRVIKAGRMAIVTAELQADSLLPKTISPGVLTLTASVGGVALDPITLTLTADGIAYPCQQPDSCYTLAEAWESSGAIPLTWNGAGWEYVPTENAWSAGLSPLGTWSVGFFPVYAQVKISTQQACVTDGWLQQPFFRCGSDMLNISAVDVQAAGTYTFMIDMTSRPDSTEVFFGYVNSYPGEARAFVIEEIAFLPVPICA